MPLSSTPCPGTIPDSDREGAVSERGSHNLETSVTPWCSPGLGLKDTYETSASLNSGNTVLPESRFDFEELISGFHTSRAGLPGEGTILTQ